MIVDASASTGTGPLTFAIDFGDGARAAAATARHVYAGPGTFTVTVEARDSQGRAASASQQVAVKTLTGSWFHAGYNPNVHRVEIRRLEIESQDGQTVRGVYKLSNAPDRPFSGTLRAPRSISIVADTTRLEGLIPGRLNEESEPWTLRVQSASLNGDPLDFRAITSAPTGPEPDADLRIRIDSLGSTVAIVGLSPIEFDGSASRGVALSYFHDFGDDQTSTAPRVTHPATRGGISTARLTVVDRFGRFDTESIRYAGFAIDDSFTSWFYSDAREFLGIRFRNRAGTNYEGTYSDSRQRSDCLAVLSGERDIRITVPALGLEFRGSIDMSKTQLHVDSTGLTQYPTMTVTQFGGAENGRVRKLSFDDGPG